MSKALLPTISHHTVTLNMAQDRMEISNKGSAVLILRTMSSRFHTKAISQTLTKLMASEEKVSVQITQ